MKRGREEEKLKAAYNRIFEIIKKSRVPEDFIHAQNTLKWLLILFPEADERMKIAAVGHDIERALEEKKVKRENFSDYNEFKLAHAKNSAKVMKTVLESLKFSKEFIEDVCRLIELHEFGGTIRADYIKDADGISFFDTNLKFYYQREGLENTRKRCEWGYKRLSFKAKEIVKSLNYEEPELQNIVQSLN